MTLRTLVVILVIGAAAGLQGCAVAVVGAGVGAMLAAEDRRTAGIQIEDERIELVAGNRIGDRYANKAHTSVTAFNRHVLLTGEVPDEQAKSEIGKLVAAVSNVREVFNELQVAGSSTLTSRSNDAFLTSKIKARFVDAGLFSAVHVKVVTEAAVVYLLGLVTEKEASDATEIARTTGGVRRVIKVFQYCRTDEDVCRPRTPPKPAAAPASAQK